MAPRHQPQAGAASVLWTMPAKQPLPTLTLHSLQTSIQASRMRRCRHHDDSATPNCPTRASEQTDYAAAAAQYIDQGTDTTSTAGMTG